MNEEDSAFDSLDSNSNDFHKPSTPLIILAGPCGGKTTICNQFPDRFYDVEQFFMLRAVFDKFKLPFFAGGGEGALLSSKYDFVKIFFEVCVPTTLLAIQTHRTVAFNLINFQNTIYTKLFLNSLKNDQLAQVKIVNVSGKELDERRRKRNHDNNNLV